MTNSLIVAAPLLIAAIVMAVRFVGCSLDEGGLESPQPYSTAVLPTAHLVSFWRLNEKSGTTAADSSGSNSGSYQNISGVTLGVANLANTDTDNRAVKFDGGAGSPSVGGGYVSVPFAANLNPPKFTVEALVNPSAIGSGDINDYHAVVSSRNIETGPVRSFGYILYLHAGSFEAWVGNDTISWASISVAAGAAADAGPYYVVMTYDGTKLTLYVDPTDTEAETATEPDHFAQSAVAYTQNATTELRIGAGGNEMAATYCFPGVIQDVAVYDDALDFATIQAHFAIAMTGFST